MNSTAPPLFLQLEKGTRTFRDRHAQHHREKWVDAKRAAKRALDAWMPLDGETPNDALRFFPQQHPGVRFVRETGEAVTTNTEIVGAAMRDALSRAKWHEGRDNGQKYRFRKLQQCGTRVMIAGCGVCGHERKPVEEGCGIARLCERCSLRAAKKRRARFGRARRRVSENLKRQGCMRRRKVAGKWYGARWSDKMLTLTLPHFLRSELDEDAGLLAFGLETCKLLPGEVDTTMARVLAIRAAWPRFAAKLRKYWSQAQRRAAKDKKPPVMVMWKDGKAAPPPLHRAFEWTPGSDGLGHPHYHVWMLCPWLDSGMVAAMWTEALREVGVPIEGRAIVTLQRFRDFNFSAVGELMKGGVNDRKALEWSRLYAGTARRAHRRGGPANAFEYADGWTIADAIVDARPEVVASLYCALEKMRLTQASAGFFAEDDPPHCAGCFSQLCWHVRFERSPEPTEGDITPKESRGPPP